MPLFKKSNNTIYNKKYKVFIYGSIIDNIVFNVYIYIYLH